MFSAEIKKMAAECLTKAKTSQSMLVTAESCTGGLLSGALTAISGASDAFDCGFVTYTNQSKQTLLGVSAKSLATFGAVSDVVAKEMAYGAIIHSSGDVAVSITGVAGPDGGTADKPVGLVWIGVAKVGQTPNAYRCDFGNMDREAVREQAVLTALTLLHKAL